MELNAEQIKKALECCASINNRCEECPIDDKKKDDCECGTFLAQNALALINSQEQRIGELAEENERLMREKTALECVVSTARNQAKADTVRKMQERLKSEIAKYFLPTLQFQANAFINQIAKEMIGDAE